MRILKLKPSLFTFSQSTTKIDWKDILTNKQSEYGIQKTPALQAILDLYSLPTDQDGALKEITGQLSLGNIINSIDSLITLGWTSINAWKAIDRVADRIKKDATSEEIVSILSSNKPLPDLEPGVQSIKQELSKFKNSISRWRNAIGLLKNANNPSYYEIFAPAKEAINVLLSNEVQTYIDGVETSMYGSPRKEVPGAIQTLKWLKETIPALVFSQSQKQKGTRKVDTKPDIKTIDFNNQDEVAEAMEHLEDVKNNFSDYDPNNEDHFNRVYLLGIEAGKELFSKEILRFRTKKYNCDDYQNGMEKASAKMKANKENVKTVLSLYDYGRNLDEVVNFGEWVSFLLCISDSKTSSIDPGTLENLCGKYVTRLNGRFPAWTRIPDFSRLPFLMQADKAKQSNPEDDYDDAVLEGINLFFDYIVKDENKYAVEEESGGSEKALETMKSKKQEIQALAKQNNTNQKLLHRFVVAASFLFCLIGSKTKSNSPKAISNLWAQYTTHMTQGIPNWNDIPELAELNVLKKDSFSIPTKETATEADIKAAWQSGMTEGLSELDVIATSQDIEFKGDIKAAKVDAGKYINSLSNQVATSISLSKTFNQKNLALFARQAVVIYAMIKAQATGKGNYNLKSTLQGMFANLDLRWKGWEDTQIFSALEKMKTTGGFGSGFSSEKAMEIWQNMMPKAIARIKAEVDKNPALANNQKFKYLFSNGWVLSKPNQLEEVFGEKLVFPESVQVAQETVRYSSTLKASNTDLTADYILNRVAAWCSGKGDYTDLEPASTQNMAQKYYQGDQSSGQPPSNPPGTRTPTWSDFPSFQQTNPTAIGPSNQKMLNPGPGTAIAPRKNMGIQPVNDQNKNLALRPNMGVGPARNLEAPRNPIQLEPAELQKKNKPQDQIKNGVYVGFQFLGTISVVLAILLSRATDKGNLILG